MPKTKHTTPPEQRYIVLESALGGLKPGIHRRPCVVLGVLTFAMRGEQTALMLPTSHTFVKLDDAKAFVASKGPLMWCVQAKTNRSNPSVYGTEIFRAHVKETHSVRYYGGPIRWERVIFRPRAKACEDTYITQVFATKAKAWAYARSHIAKETRECEKALLRYALYLEQLQATCRKFAAK
jgi:hypothetical protein